MKDRSLLKIVVAMEEFDAEFVSPMVVGLWNLGITGLNNAMKPERRRDATWNLLMPRQPPNYDYQKDKYHYLTIADAISSIVYDLENALRFLFLLEKWGQGMNKKIVQTNVSKEQVPRLSFGSLHRASDSLKLLHKELSKRATELKAFEILLVRISGVPSIFADGSKLRTMTMGNIDWTSMMAIATDAMDNIDVVKDPFWAFRKVTIVEPKSSCENLKNYFNSCRRHWRDLADVFGVSKKEETLARHMLDVV